MKIDLEKFAASDLPVRVAVGAVTMTELAAGPHAARDAVERARGQDRLRRAEAMFGPRRPHWAGCTSQDPGTSSKGESHL